MARQTDRGRMGEGKRVKAHSRLTIVPSKPTPSGKVHPFSTLDLSMKQHRSCAAYYFPGAATFKPRTRLIDDLKESLCQVLSTYPILAGRLRLCEAEEGASSAKWEIKCNDAGVRVYEAVAEVTLEDWLQHSPDESEICTAEVIPDHTISPVLVVQFTDFKCDSLAIGLSWVHMLGDQSLGTLFMKSWGEVHRAAQIMHPPFFHPPSLKPRQPPPNLATRTATYYKTTFLAPSSSPVPSSPEPEYASAIFKFSHAAVEHLLSQVQSGAHAYGSPTPFEALAALFWVAVAKAQDKKGMAEMRVSLCLEVRKIQIPPLPYGYFGNALIFVGVKTSAEELLGKDPSFAAGLISENVNTTDTEEIKSVVDLLKVKADEKEEGIEKKPTLFFGPDLTIASWDHFFSYEAVFSFGKPSLVTYGIQPLQGEGFIQVLPSAAEGNLSRNVVVSLPLEYLSRLQEDETLISLLSL